LAKVPLLSAPRPEKLETTAKVPLLSALRPEKAETTDLPARVLSRSWSRIHELYGDIPVYITGNGACYNDEPVEGIVADQKSAARSGLACPCGLQDTRKNKEGQLLLVPEYGCE
ncbi:hypothetical protein P4H54_26810, partial [Paenibacillus graminis]|nr:hypothetical protein [Paenibacillus graminis]